MEALIHLIEKQHSYDDRTEIVGWFPDYESASTWVMENPPEKYDYIYVYRLAEGGKIEEVETHQYIPEVYRGPLVSIGLRSHRNDRGYAHRVPIDCMRPTWPHHVMTEDNPVRIVSNSCCGTDHQHQGESYMMCHCGEWVEWEGSPEAIAEIVRRNQT